MMLTTKKIESLKPKASVYRVAEGSGLSLFIEVAPSGSRLWRLRYRFGGKAKTLALGHYPDVSLAEARRKAAEARDMLAEGIDPNAERKAAKAVERLGTDNTFGVVTAEWQKHTWPALSEATRGKQKAIIDQHILPHLGDRPMNSITTAEVVATVKRLTGRGVLDLAKRCKSLIGRIFSYAVAHGLAERNPARDFTASDVIPRRATRHHLAVTTTKELGEMLRAIDGYGGGEIAKAATLLSAMLFQRPGEMRQMKWADVDLDGAMWKLPAEVMKLRIAHSVPLPRQAVALLRETHRLTGAGTYVFPSIRSTARPLSENTVCAVLSSVGWGEKQTAHGFRATGRSIIAEVLNWEPVVIEAALAHLPPGPLGATYARVAYIEQRKKMHQEYADLLDELRGKTPLKLAA